MITLQQSDFTGVGNIAKHCNLDKLDIAINEAILFDLKPLLCDLFFEVDDNWEDTEGIWFDLIAPKEFTGCNDRKKSHQGLKNALIRYSYARYVILNPYDDTPNGGVTKSNDWSIPKPYNDLKQISDRYRSMAYEMWKEVEAYICLNKDVYDAEQFDCKSCGCNGKCGSKTKSKGYGISGTNIKGYGM